MAENATDNPSWRTDAEREAFEAWASRGPTAVSPNNPPPVRRMSPARRRVLGTLEAHGASATRREIKAAEPITLCGRDHVPTRKFPGQVIDDLERLGWITVDDARRVRRSTDATIWLTRAGWEVIQEEILREKALESGEELASKSLGCLDPSDVDDVLRAILDILRRPYYRGASSEVKLDAIRILLLTADAVSLGLAREARGRERGE